MSPQPLDMTVNFEQLDTPGNVTLWFSPMVVQNSPCD